MKPGYVVALVVVLLLGIWLILLLISSPLGNDPRTGNAIQVAAVFVALAAAIIALGAADQRQREVRADVQAYVPIEGAISHGKANLTDKLEEAFSHLPDPFTSYKVHFRITNKSGFELVAPTVTFRLPLDRRHLHMLGSTQIATFNSNLFSSQDEIRILEFGDTQVLSNNNLPYWNDGEEITIWIRMSLEPMEFHPFEVGLSVNAQNASGFITSIRISPSFLRS